MFLVEDRLTGGNRPWARLVVQPEETIMWASVRSMLLQATWRRKPTVNHTRPHPRATWLVSVLALVSLGAGTPVTPSQDGKDPGSLDEYGADHLVVAGGKEPGWPADQVQRFEYLAYYPTELQIHRGDVVFFDIEAAWHTVTFTPEGEPRTGFWRQDEAEPILQWDNHVPSDPTCGTSAQAPPCVFDSPDQLVNSGWDLELPPHYANDLKLQVDLPEGVYTYYCTIHTGMEGTIEVVPDEQPIATPSEVEADRQAALAADTAEAVSLLEHPPAMRPPEQVGDNRRWFVQVGALTANQHVNIKQFFPPSLEIAPGDEVELFAPDAGPLPGRVESAYGVHTASFEPGPLRAAVDDSIAFGYYINPMCDPDDPASGLPGMPLPSAIFVGCPLESQTFEVAAQPWAMQDPLRAPDDLMTPGTFHDSGLLFPSDVDCRAACDPYTGERFASEMRAVFPVTGEYGYRCFVHGVMDGAITVSG